MKAIGEMLHPREAAIVALVGLGDVDRAVDEHILPPDFVSDGGERRIMAVGCPLLSFYFGAAGQLTVEARLDAIRLAQPKLARAQAMTPEALAREDWRLGQDYLTIDLEPFVTATQERLARLRAARAQVEISPEIMAGTPVIRGTRIPVHDAGIQANRGVPLADILEMYPRLNAEKVALAALYAEAYPSTRKQGPLRLPPGTRIISERIVTLPAKAR